MTPLFVLALLASSLGASSPGGNDKAPVQLMPVVKEVRWDSSHRVTEGVIVIADKATPPEQYAAELFQRTVERRFGQKWGIHKDSEGPGNAKLAVLLGLPNSHPRLAQFLKSHPVAMPEKADGYVLKVATEGDKVVAAVAGTNVRGVIYGQDTLFQLFSKKGDALQLQVAEIRDWPTIPLRGRPHPHYQYFFKQENFDCTMVSRMNFIDIREGIYAFDPGAKINKDEVRGVADDARRRGLRVYAVVNCGVKAAEYDGVIALFKEFLALGTDALWLSFDDKGPGEAPKEIVARVIALGRERGITGDGIAITPPKGSYQTIVTDFNRQIMSVPGMEQAVWYWTGTPCAEDSADAKSIGLKVEPSWWHNWPRYRPPAFGSSHEGNFSPAISLANGWNHPTDAELREAGKYAHAILPWDGWQSQQYNLVPSLGWWSWRPEAHDFLAVRRRMYDIEYGPGQVKAATDFEDGLAALQKKFIYSLHQSEAQPLCPPRLRTVSSRAEVIASFEQLRPLVALLKEKAPGATLLEADTLQKQYLAPMGREIDAGVAEASAPYPEYWWEGHQRIVQDAIYDGDLASADKAIEMVRPRLTKDLEAVEHGLAGFHNPRGYLDWWRKRAAMNAADWKSMLERRQKALPDRVAEYSRTVVPVPHMIKDLVNPPVQMGTGPWEGHNRVLATVLPENREIARGDWIAGLYDAGGTRVAAFAMDRHMQVDEGGFVELPVNIPISGQRDRLALLLNLSNVNKESFGFGFVKWRWAGYRSLTLLWGDKKIRQIDLGIPRPYGEWMLINLPTLPEDLKVLPLRLRIDDYRYAKNNYTLALVSPIRLLELDRE